MIQATTIPRAPRSARTWSRRSVLGGLLLLAAPLGIHAQQQAAPQSPGGKPDNAQLCSAMMGVMGYVMQHPDLLKGMIVISPPPSGVAPADSVPFATRQAIATALMQRNFDSAAALMQRALPDGNDPQAAAAITKVFRSLAVISDSAQLGHIADAITQASGNDLQSADFKLFAALPDTLRTTVVSLMAAAPDARLSCTLSGPPPVAAPSPAPAPKP